MLEGIPPGLRQTHGLVWLEINFTGEAFAGDTVISGCRPETPDRTVFTHCLVRAETGQELVRARTRWQPL